MCCAAVAQEPLTRDLACQVQRGCVSRRWIGRTQSRCHIEQREARWNRTIAPDMPLSIRFRVFTTAAGKGYMCDADARISPHALLHTRRDSLSRTLATTELRSGLEPPDDPWPAPNGRPLPRRSRAPVFPGCQRCLGNITSRPCIATEHAHRCSRGPGLNHLARASVTKPAGDPGEAFDAAGQAGPPLALKPG
jgi:hypothetical protein